MNDFPFLVQRLFNTVHAIEPTKAAAIVAAIGGRLGLGSLVNVQGDAIVLPAMAFDDEMETDAAAERRRTDKGYDVVAGVAVVQVQGTLVQKQSGLRPVSGMTGYNAIRQNVLAALDDPEVKAIVFEVDSPGGEVHGCFDLCDMIHSRRGEKPMWAILAEHAYSAAYAIASAADVVTIPRTGGLGSIGCIMLHFDFSKALDQAGVRVTLIKYGDRKYEGSEFEPLSKVALAHAQSQIDATGEIFVETVARNRGLKPTAVRATQALTYQGNAAIAAGLADRLMAPEDEAFPALLSQLARSEEGQRDAKQRGLVLAMRRVAKQK